MRKRQNTYQRDPAGIAEAEARLRALCDQPDAGLDTSWQEELPEVPEDDEATLVEVFE